MLRVSLCMISKIRLNLRLEGGGGVEGGGVGLKGIVKVDVN